jgi:hypothetical protein
MMAQTPMEMEESLIANAKEMVIEATDVRKEINIYPNPTTGEFVIDFSGKLTTADILLYNFQGKQFLEKKCIDQLKMDIDMGSLPAGMYIIVIRNQTETIIKRIMKTL